MILGGGADVTVDIPAPPSVVVLPVVGPPGPPGDSDVTDLIDRVDALEAEHRGWTETVSSPTLLVQVVHGMPVKPAGVRCIDPAGLVEPATVTDPAAGVTEVTFGNPFTGQIILS